MAEFTHETRDGFGRAYRTSTEAIDGLSRWLREQPEPWMFTLRINQGPDLDCYGWTADRPAGKP